MAYKIGLFLIGAMLTSSLLMKNKLNYRAKGRASPQKSPWNHHNKSTIVYLSLDSSNYPNQLMKKQINRANQRNNWHKRAKRPNLSRTTHPMACQTSAKCNKATCQGLRYRKLTNKRWDRNSLINSMRKLTFKMIIRRSSKLLNSKMTSTNSTMCSHKKWTKALCHRMASKNNNNNNLTNNRLTDNSPKTLKSKQTIQTNKNPKKMTCKTFLTLTISNSLSHSMPRWFPKNNKAKIIIMMRKLKMQIPLQSTTQTIKF